MDLRRVTGYIALTLLAGYWLWVFSRTAPELRKGARDRWVRGQVLLVKTAALVLTALFVGTVHFWASSWWQVVAAVPVTLLGAVALRRAHRRLVALPRHRIPLAQQVRRTGHFQIIRTPGAPPPHRHAATDDGALPGAVPFVVPGPSGEPGPAPGPEAGPDDPAPEGDPDECGHGDRVGSRDAEPTGVQPTGAEPTGAPSSAPAGEPIPEPTGEPGADRTEQDGRGDRSDPPMA